MVLTVAHVFDKRPEACSLLNLAALCQRCHLRHDLADHRQIRRERKHKGQMSWLGEEAERRGYDNRRETPLDTPA